MNSRELMRAAVRGEPVERIPTMPQICYDNAVRMYEEDWIDGLINCLKDPARIHEYVERLVRDVGCDGLRIFAYRREPVKIMREGDEVYQIDPKTGERIGKTDLHGGGYLMPFQPPSPIETLEDAEKAVQAYPIPLSRSTKSNRLGSGYPICSLHPIPVVFRWILIPR